MPIYTKTGDRGETRLTDGRQLSKAEPIFRFIGALDRLNSTLGMCFVEVNQTNQPVIFSKETQLILELQRDLFTLGALVSLAKTKFDFVSKTRTLETLIDEYEAQLPPLKQFILPGGSTVAVWLHLARVGAREVERQAVACRQLPEKSVALPYFNRLSDLLFVMARWVNFKLGVDEVTWKKAR